VERIRQSRVVDGKENEAWGGKCGSGWEMEEREGLTFSSPNFTVLGLDIVRQ